LFFFIFFFEKCIHNSKNCIIFTVLKQTQTSKVAATLQYGTKTMKTTTEITTREIFEKNQVLTLELAKALKGKRIICTSAEYRMNTPGVKEFVVGEIISAWDEAARRPYYDLSKFDNYQDYWASYMTGRQIQAEKDKLLLLGEDGQVKYGAHKGEFNHYGDQITFTGSDADREVYFIEL
jgi:hypothetical protein